MRPSEAFQPCSAAGSGCRPAGPASAGSTNPIRRMIAPSGRRSATVDLAEARRDQAVSSYEQTIQVAFKDVSDALSARRWLAEQVEVLRATVDAQSERARLAKLRYDHGASPYLEVLDAQRDLLAAQQKLAQTRRALLSSRVRLYAALGGGTQASLPAQAAAGTTEASPR